MERHVVTGVFDGKGMCSVCGPVFVSRDGVYKGRQKWRCRVRLRIYKHGIQTPVHPMPEVCESCGRARKLQMDHKGTEFRGWLCGPCNRAIGASGDDEHVLLSAARFLQRIRANQSKGQA